MLFGGIEINYLISCDTCFISVDPIEKDGYYWLVAYKELLVRVSDEGVTEIGLIADLLAQTVYPFWHEGVPVPETPYPARLGLQSSDLSYHEFEFIDLPENYGGLSPEFICLFSGLKFVNQSRRSVVAKHDVTRNNHLLWSPLELLDFSERELRNEEMRSFNWVRNRVKKFRP